MSVFARIYKARVTLNMAVVAHSGDVKQALVF